MEYCEELAFNDLHSVGQHIKFNIESIETVGSIWLLHPKCLPNKDHSAETSVYRKLTHIDQYLDCIPKPPISDKKNQ